MTVNRNVKVDSANAESVDAEKVETLSPVTIARIADVNEYVRKNSGTNGTKATRRQAAFIEGITGEKLSERDIAILVLAGTYSRMQESRNEGSYLEIVKRGPNYDEKVIAALR